MRPDFFFPSSNSVRIPTPPRRGQRTLMISFSVAPLSNLTDPSTESQFPTRRHPFRSLQGYHWKKRRPLTAVIHPLNYDRNYTPFFLDTRKRPENPRRGPEKRGNKSILAPHNCPANRFLPPPFNRTNTHNPQAADPTSSCAHVQSPPLQVVRMPAPDPVGIKFG